MGGLAFSRKDESEADNLAVYYLSHTDYNPLGVAGFFEKLQKQGAGSTKELDTYFSTHPATSDRIERIHAAWQAYGAKKGNDYVER
jgi:predicted Zn-dependent protease